PAPIPLLRKKLPHARLVLYAHNQLFNTYTPREIRHILAHADAILCVSNFLAKDLTTRARITSPKIKIVHNAVDTDLFTPAPSPPTGIPTILFLGRMLPEKGPDLLLKAAAQIANPQRPFTLRLVGSQNFNANDPLSPYEQSLRSLAAHPALAGRTEFLPFTPRQKLPDLYHSASLFVVPSNWDEPFGLTVAEALASGLPTIASNRGGIPEAAENAALYFSPPNTDQLAAHLAALLDNPGHRSALAAKSRARALQLSTAAQYAALTKALHLP
ncbi:MAG TPA: glycosyltransferase family 4 protein, partial [Phycisphaerae bacterium]|nr:glycosyltransferase family 4 protein [Phycisphaerae bacterium]